jgi:hypothetical protein
MKKFESVIDWSPKDRTSANTLPSVKGIPDVPKNTKAKAEQFVVPVRLSSLGSIEHRLLSFLNSPRIGP